MSTVHIGPRAMFRYFYTLLLLVFFLPPKVSAQSYNWTWMGGDSLGNVQPVYGQVGKPSAQNTPGGRAGACAWRDANGQVWLFAGYTGDPFGHRNDMWKWDGSAWTWMRGSVRPNEFGTYDQPTPYPGARSNATYAYANGTLYVFGGIGYGKDNVGQLSDFWKWDGTQWT